MSQHLCAFDAFPYGVSQNPLFQIDRRAVVSATTAVTLTTTGFPTLKAPP